MSEFLQSLLHVDENIEKTGVKRLLSDNLKEKNRGAVNKLMEIMLTLEENNETFTISETLRSEMLNIIDNLLEENPGEFNLVNAAQHLLLKSDKKDSEAESKNLLSIKQGDIVKLSSNEVEDMLVVVQEVNHSSATILCAPFLTDIFIATKSSFILDPKDSTLEIEAAVLLDYLFEVDINHISTYIGRCYKEKGNEQGISKHRRGVSLKATQDVRDIGRARLARIINFYASNEATLKSSEYVLDPIISDSRKEESIS